MTGGGNWPTLTTTGKTLHTEGQPDLHIPRVEEDRLANLLWHLRFASDQTDQRINLLDLDNSHWTKHLSALLLRNQLGEKALNDISED